MPLVAKLLDRIFPQFAVKKLKKVAITFVEWVLILHCCACTLLARNPSCQLPSH